MCAAHLTKEQATELVDAILNDLESIGTGASDEIEDELKSLMIQNLTKVRDGFINAH